MAGQRRIYWNLSSPQSNRGLIGMSKSIPFHKTRAFVRGIFGEEKSSSEGDEEEVDFMIDASKVDENAAFFEFEGDDIYSSMNSSTSSTTKITKELDFYVDGNMHCLQLKLSDSASVEERSQINTQVPVESEREETRIDRDSSQDARKAMGGQDFPSTDPVVESSSTAGLEASRQEDHESRQQTLVQSTVGGDFGSGTPSVSNETAENVDDSRVHRDTYGQMQSPTPALENKQDTCREIEKTDLSSALRAGDISVSNPQTSGRSHPAPLKSKPPSSGNRSKKRKAQQTLGSGALGTSPQPTKIEKKSKVRRKIRAAMKSFKLGLATKKKKNPCNEDEESETASLLFSGDDCRPPLQKTVNRRSLRTRRKARSLVCSVGKLAKKKRQSEKTKQGSFPIYPEQKYSSWGDKRGFYGRVVEGTTDEYFF